MRPPSLAERAARLAALGEPARLAIVDELRHSDRAPAELGRRLGMPSNLLAHHLDVLAHAGLVERSRSSGDGRRRYVHLRPAALEHLLPSTWGASGPALFVCTASSARSPLAAALWRATTGQPAWCAGTDPADALHAGAVAAARRAGLDLSGLAPTALAEVAPVPDLVVTVCDRAHEDLDPHPAWLHWSVPDPVATGTARAFDGTLDELRARIRSLAGDLGRVA